MKFASTKRGLFAGLVMVGLVVLTAGCAKEQAAPPVRPPSPVTIAAVTTKTMPVVVNSVGNVEAISTVAIKALVAGEIKEIHFKEGDFVKKDQVLFVIDPAPYEATLAQAKAALARDKAVAINDRAQADRYVKLLAEGVVPASQVDSYTSAADASDATVKSDEAIIQTAQLNLAYCTISSPLDGRTGAVMLKPGNLVKVADVPIVVINQVDPVYVNFTVPQQYWTAIKTYMAKSTLGVLATVPQDPGPPINGTLTFVDNAVDSTTGTIHLRATFRNGENRLWPGLYVNTVLTLSQQANATIVPSEALVASQQGPSVFVVKANNTVEQRPVKTDRTIDGQTVILDGVRPGETVVVDGQVQLIPGAKIERKNNLNPADPANPADQDKNAAGTTPGPKTE